MTQATLERTKGGLRARKLTEEETDNISNTWWLLGNT